MASGIYSNFKLDVLKKATNLDTGGDTIKVALMGSGFSFSAANTLWSDVSANELAIDSVLITPVFLGDSKVYPAAFSISTALGTNICFTDYVLSVLPANISAEFKQPNINYDYIQNTSSLTLNLNNYVVRVNFDFTQSANHQIISAVVINPSEGEDVTVNIVENRLSLIVNGVEVKIFQYPKICLNTMLDMSEIVLDGILPPELINS